MINTFRSSYPLRLILAATLLLSIVLPVVQVACSFGGEVSPQEGREVVVGERGIAGHSGCYQSWGVLASSHQQVDRCQREAATRDAHDCEFRPFEVVEVVPVPPTAELPRVLAAPLSFWVDLTSAALSESLHVAVFPRPADGPEPQTFVSLRVLFSSFLI